MFRSASAAKQKFVCVCVCVCASHSVGHTRITAIYESAAPTEGELLKL